MSELHNQWLLDGYVSAPSRLQCSKDLVSMGGSVHNKCVKHRRAEMCSKTNPASDSNATVPNSHICDGKVSEEGNYRVCAVRELQPGPDGCVVISIGGNNIWDFEVAIHQHTTCEIHTFDPREKDNRFGKVIKPPERIADRTYFHHAALDKNRRGLSFTFPQVLQLANVTATRPLLIFKIDCEGCEFHMLPWIHEQGWGHLLPAQVLTEFHQYKHRDFHVGNVTSSYLNFYKTMLIDLGYAIFDTRNGDGGCEHGFVRYLDFPS